jgi:hypothetical protein
MINFINKNIRIIALILMLLFCFKCIQGCNRSNKIEKRNKTIISLTDSIKEINNIAKDSINYLHNEINKLNFALDIVSKNASDMTNIAKKVAEKKSITYNTIKMNNDKDK